jgi:phosphoglucosamine mutase
LSQEDDRPRLFGTDGIRGRYGDGWLTPDRVSAIGRVVGETMADERASGRALVAHDGRRSGPELEAAITRGLSAAGYEVVSAGLLATPAVALLGRLQPFDLAVMISASHNPAHDNGIKIFGARGEKLDDGIERRIEEELQRDATPVTEGPAPLHDDGLEALYLDYLGEAFAALDLSGMVIALDCANGAGSRVAPRILGRLGAHVVSIACSPDGENINHGCGSTHPEGLQEAVRMNGADLGIALDGDGDRCILVDEHGALVNGDGILTVLARNAIRHERLGDPRIVATVMSNRGLHRALREVGLGVVSVGVGDRRVVEALRSEQLSLGGEQSGHIVCGAEHHYIGDGTYTALRVLAALREENAPLSSLAAPYRPFPQVLVNVPVTRKPDLDAIPAVREAVRSVEDAWGEDGRVLLRYSGTEPLARVMVEGPDEERIRSQAQELAALIARELAD